MKMCVNLLRRGVNGLRARLLHFAILRWEKYTPIPHPSPNEALTGTVVRIEKKESGNLWYGELACLLY